MPITPTYPGVYVEEIPSGVRTITGVATSITAFIGRTLRGLENEPTIINNFSDFERMFGGLNVDYPLSYAVRDFYLNGGSQAIIVRLFNDGTLKKKKEAGEIAEKAANDVLKPIQDAKAQSGATVASLKTAARNAANQITEPEAKKAADAVVRAAETVADSETDLQKVVDAAINAVKLASTAARGTVTLSNRKASKLIVIKKAASEDEKDKGFTLEASSPGAWGNNLSIKVDYDGISKDVADRYGLSQDSLFNLTIIENPPKGPREIIRNVSIQKNAGSRRLDRVLEQESQLVRVQMNGDEISGIEQDMTLPPKQDPSNPDIKPDQLQKSKFTGGADSDLLEPINFELKRNDSDQPIDKTGLYALDKADLFNLLCIPPEVRTENTKKEIYKLALPYCVKRRAMLIVDPPIEWSANKETAAAKAKAGLTELGLSGTDARNAILYFPRVIQADPLREGQLDTFVPCGIIAGVMARTDTQRGVWKAPAGIDAALNGIVGLQVNLSDDENGMLNPLGINCLRNFPVYGRVVWGSRTLRGADQLADEYKYVPVRRLLLYLQESLYRGTQWIVFEPNDEPLWSQIRLNIGAFMNNLFKQGAFQGKTPKEAYFVKCDSETTTQNDINLGIVNIVIGFAPLKPAEFVILKFQQMAGQIAT
ncbi:phage tail sheath C-terminal domain-containing protein [Aerosakkonemataceae cyanobacterium BLCC-F50]|uniref:Phage tail sheath C-terminal domain-containing protein n=1 Tax=Floridaenema flaviceps BLCC-F50 TaxID=3153642 RepID=A0ABV4XSW4_9CYAN